MAVRNPYRLTIRLGGDLSRNLPTVTVTGFQGRTFAATPPVGGDFIGWNGTQWAPTVGPSGSFAAGGDLTGTSSNQTVVGLQTVPVSATVPSLGQVLTYSGADWAPATPAGSTATSVDELFGCIVTVAVGDAVYVSAPSTVDRANANSALTAPAIGIVVSKPTGVTAVVRVSGTISGLAGLVAGRRYFLATSAGGLVTPPVDAGGNVAQVIGIATSTTTLMVNPEPTFVLM